MYKKNKNIRFLPAVVMLISSQAFADDVLTLRFAHWLPEHHPLARYGFAKWASSISAATNGSIKFEFHPAQKMGSAKDHYDMARDGVADITWVNPGYQPGRFPIVEAVEFPFMVRNGDVGSRAVHEWYEPYARQEMSDVKVCITHVNDPGTLHSKMEIRRPEQLRGLRVRPSNASVGSYISNLGGASVQVAAPEVRDALGSGVADAIFYPAGSFWLYGLNDMAKYHVDLPMYVNVANLVINKSIYEKMSASQRRVVDEHCTAEWSVRFAKPWNLFEKGGWQRLRDTAGHTMVKLSDEESKAWLDSADGLRRDWSERVGAQGYGAEKILNDLRASLEKHSAQF